MRNNATFTAPEELRRRSVSVRRRFLSMYHRTRAGHVGSSLSCAELLTFVRFGWMKPGDELVLSKGHAAGALYSMLIEAGDLDESAAETFLKDGTFLSAHPPPGKLKGVPFATGSLGHGLSLAAGIALGEKLHGRGGRAFCITSDGELNEGSIWEAALFAAHHKLSNLVWLIDRNRLQGFGRTEDVMRLEPLGEKLAAFGFQVFDVDGHSFPALLDAKANVEGKPMPTALLCNTVKGRGLGEMEDTVDCHYLPMTDAQYAAAVRRLDEEAAS